MGDIDSMNFLHLRRRIEKMITDTNSICVQDVDVNMNARNHINSYDLNHWTESLLVNVTLKSGIKQARIENIMNKYIKFKDDIKHDIEKEEDNIFHIVEQIVSMNKVIDGKRFVNENDKPLGTFLPMIIKADPKVIKYKNKVKSYQKLQAMPIINVKRTHIKLKDDYKCDDIEIEKEENNIFHIIEKIVSMNKVKDSKKYNGVKDYFEKRMHELIQNKTKRDLRNESSHENCDGIEDNMYKWTESKDIK